MTRPTARVLTLLEILQGGGTHTVARLAERLGVDERTVRRYASHLLDLEVPITTIRGRHGGYRLAPGWRMPPLMLTGEEALAVLFGLVASRRAGLASTSADAAASADAKIRRVLPNELADRLDALLGSVDFTTPDRDPAPADTTLLLRLAEAIRRRRPAAIAYVDRDDRRSTRILHPYGIVAHSQHWYVVGLDPARGASRSLRLDRIAELRIAPGTFAAPPDFRPADAVLAGLAETPWRHHVVVTVHGPAATVRARLRPGLATVEETTDPDRVVVRLRAERLDWLPGVLGGLGLPFVIVEPAELRTVVRVWAERLAGFAASSPADEPPAPPTL